MINPTRVIEMTATGHFPQFVLGDYKYDNSDFFITVMRLKRMYENEHARKGDHFSLNPFKVRKL